MKDSTQNDKNWWMEGLIFENCSCQIVCHGHVSYKQLCTYERCVGHWSIHIDKGQFHGVPLDGLNIVILYDTPQLMINGGWTEALYIDERANEAQRQAIEHIITGQEGGPWVVLSRFVTKRLETRYLPIHFEDQGRRKRMWIEGYFHATIESIRGQDRSRDVLIENMFNQIHGSPQVIASGESSYEDGELAASMKGTHALYSRFSWAGQ